MTKKTSPFDVSDLEEINFKYEHDEQSEEHKRCLDCEETRILDALIEERQRLKKIVADVLDELDLEFGVATNVIETETGHKVTLPEGMEELMDMYWRYVFTQTKKRLGIS